MSITSAIRLHESGEHSAEALFAYVTISNPKETFDLGTSTFVGKDSSGKILPKSRHSPTAFHTLHSRIKSSPLN